MIWTFAMTLAGVVLGQLLPGPNLLGVAGAALGQDRRTALAVALGVASAIFAWSALPAFELGTVLAAPPALVTVLKLLGGGYLCYLAARALIGAICGGNIAYGTGRACWNPAEAWRRGLLVNLTNPKAALMWGAVATFLFGSGLSAWEVLAFAPFGFASAVMVYGIYAILFSSAAARRGYARFHRGIEGLFGAAFGRLGGELVVSGLRDAGASW